MAFNLLRKISTGRVAGYKDVNIGGLESQVTERSISEVKLLGVPIGTSLPP